MTTTAGATLPAPDVPLDTTDPADLLPLKPSLGREDLVPILGTDEPRVLWMAIEGGHFPRPDYKVSPRNPRWLRATLVEWLRGQARRAGGAA